MKSFVFSTGRIYNCPQNLEIKYSFKYENEFFGTLNATFTDHSRGIKGEVNILFVSLDSTNAKIGSLILHAYDTGNFNHV